MLNIERKSNKKKEGGCKKTPLKEKSLRP